MKPYTSKAKKAIDLAARISKKMNYSYVGTEHILAGLIKEGTGVAAEVLTACNVALYFKGNPLALNAVGQVPAGWKIVGYLKSCNIE